MPSSLFGIYTAFGSIPKLNFGLYAGDVPSFVILIINLTNCVSPLNIVCILVS